MHCFTTVVPLLLLLVTSVQSELGNRLVVYSQTVSEPFARNNEYSFRYEREYSGGVNEPLPIYIDSDPFGVIRIAWTATNGNVHVTSVDSGGSRLTFDIVLTSTPQNPIKSVRGLACTDSGGFALLVVWPHQGEEHKDGMMYFILFNSDGNEVKRTLLDRRALRFELGDGDLKYGPYGPDGTPHFVAYFKVTGKNPGAAHEGDTLLLIDENGVEQDPIWNWGCSHPQMNEVVLNPWTNALGAFCTSDAFPSTGIIFNRATNIFPARGDSSGHVAAGLGDIIPTREGFLVSLAGPRNNDFESGTDVAVMLIDHDGNEQWKKWITNTPNEFEHSVHMARYGDDNFLLFWAQTTPTGKQPYRPAGNRLFVVELRPTNNNIRVVGETTELTGRTDWQERPNFITLRDGGVAWPAVFGGQCNRGLCVDVNQGYAEDRTQLRFNSIQFQGGTDGDDDDSNNNEDDDSVLDDDSTAPTEPAKPRTPREKEEEEDEVRVNSKGCMHGKIKKFWSTPHRDGFGPEKVFEKSGKRQKRAPHKARLLSDSDDNENNLEPGAVLDAITLMGEQDSEEGLFDTGRDPAERVGGTVLPGGESAVWFRISSLDSDDSYDLCSLRIILGPWHIGRSISLEVSGFQSKSAARLRKGVKDWVPFTPEPLQRTIQTVDDLFIAVPVAFPSVRAVRILTTGRLQISEINSYVRHECFTDWQNKDRPAKATDTELYTPKEVRDLCAASCSTRMVKKIECATRSGKTPWMQTGQFFNVPCSLARGGIECNNKETKAATGERCKDYSVRWQCGEHLGPLEDEGPCTTEWLDNGAPDETGEREMHKHGQACSKSCGKGFKATSVQCVLTGDERRSSVAAGQDLKTTCQIKKGLGGMDCRHKANKPDTCFDYKVRFICEQE